MITTVCEKMDGKKVGITKTKKRVVNSAGPCESSSL